MPLYYSTLSVEEFANLTIEEYARLLVDPPIELYCVKQAVFMPGADQVATFTGADVGGFFAPGADQGVITTDD